MTVKHTHQLRTALVAAPKVPQSQAYSMYYVGGNTRAAVIGLIAAVEEAAATLRAIDTGDMLPDEVASTLQSRIDEVQDILEPYLHG
jgi:hypothetical protein